MPYKPGLDRDQITLFPEAIEDYIEEDNPIRFIDAFADSLKIEFRHSKVSETGRPPYNPKDLLKLYLYGYINAIRSSRKLEKECHKNIELMWLLKRLAPDHKTIANFRKDNKEEIPKVFKEFTLLCKKLKLFSGELASIDGSKFKAVNSKKKNIVKAKTEARIKEIEKQISDYLEQIEENDRKEESTKALTKEELLEKIETVKKRKEYYEDLKAKMDETGEKQISIVDPDSRLMMNNRKMEVCYNVQTVVDGENKLIMDYDVTNEVCDINQLSNMATKAQEITESENLEILADKGYYNSSEIKKCVDKGMTLFIARPEASGTKNQYKMEMFKYLKEKDVYICPGKQELTYRTQRNKEGRIIKTYRTDACKQCDLRSHCTQNQTGRIIERWLHEEILEDIRDRLKEKPERYFLRRCLSEHPFGTIKRTMNAAYLLVKGFPKVKAEISLIMLSYNIKRVIKTIGIKKLIEALA